MSEDLSDIEDVPPVEQDPVPEGDIEDVPPVEQDPVPESQSKSKKRWKLKNAEMRILDVFTKIKPGGSKMLVVRMEFTLKNQQNKKMVAGK